MKTPFTNRSRFIEAQIIVAIGQTETVIQAEEVSYKYSRPYHFIIAGRGYYSFSDGEKF